MLQVYPPSHKHTSTTQTPPNMHALRPERIWLLRAQQSRGVGANSWRMSHNNYRGSVYDLTDALGIVVWDENRDLREMGLEAMDKMVRAHRHHPSIAVWSLCNEGGECIVRLVRIKK